MSFFALLSQSDKKVIPIWGMAQSQPENGAVGTFKLCKTGILEDGDRKTTINSLSQYRALAVFNEKEQ